MLAEYVWPSEAQLVSVPDRLLLSTLQYSCLTCNKTCGTAESMKVHQESAKHKKKLEAEQKHEVMDIVHELNRFMMLEQPHRDANKFFKECKQAEFRGKKEFELAAMSPAQRRAFEAESAKRKRDAESEKAMKAVQAPPAKKAKVSKAGNQPTGNAKAPKVAKLSKMAKSAGEKKPKNQNDQNLFRCSFCNVAMNSEAQMQAHVQSKKHLERMNGGPPVCRDLNMPKKPKVPNEIGAAGCELCGLPGPMNPNHFESKLHTMRMSGDFSTPPPESRGRGGQNQKKGANSKGGSKGKGDGKGKGFGKDKSKGKGKDFFGSDFFSSFAEEMAFGNKGYGKMGFDNMGKGQGKDPWSNDAPKGKGKNNGNQITLNSTMQGKGYGKPPQPQVAGCMVCSISNFLPEDHFDSWEHWQNMEQFNANLRGNLGGF